jgi:hypothetical protein
MVGPGETGRQDIKELLGGQMVKVTVCVKSFGFHLGDSSKPNRVHGIVRFRWGKEAGRGRNGRPGEEDN